MKKLSKEQLRALIKDKFGTISRFILLSGLPERKVRSSLHRDIPSAVAYRQVIRQAAHKPMEMQGLQELDITPEMAEKVRVSIYTNYKNATGFHDAHPEFSQTFISHVINGVRKRNDERFKKLLEILNIT